MTATGSWWTTSSAPPGSFLGTTWQRADAATYAAVHAILSGPAAGPAELRRVNWELAPFYCTGCGLNYCRADWDTHVWLDEGFYDCTMGTCPRGHRHKVDD